MCNECEYSSGDMNINTYAICIEDEWMMNMLWKSVTIHVYCADVIVVSTIKL